MTDNEAGFTLVELIVSLAIFGLLALAGLGLVNGILGIQQRTSGRLDRLGDIQRALYVTSSDLEQMQAGPLASDGTALLFSRPLATAGGLPVEVRYRLDEGSWTRILQGRRQVMLPSVSTLRFRFWTRPDGWLGRWPPSEQRLGDWPAAVEVQATLGTSQPGGTVRRLVVLPSRP